MNLRGSKAVGWLIAYSKASTFPNNMNRIAFNVKEQNIAYYDTQK